MNSRFRMFAIAGTLAMAAATAACGPKPETETTSNTMITDFNVTDEEEYVCPKGMPSYKCDSLKNVN